MTYSDKWVAGSVWREPCDYLATYEAIISDFRRTQSRHNVTFGKIKFGELDSIGAKKELGMTIAEDEIFVYGEAEIIEGEIDLTAYRVQGPHC